MIYVSFVIHLIMIAIFSLSFFTKLSAFDDFKLHIHSYKFVPQSFVTFTASMVLIIEILLVIGFAIGEVLLTNTVTIVLLAAFSVILKWKQENAECNCFGNVSWLNRLPLMRNAILLLLVITDMFIHSREFKFIQLAMAMCIFVTVGLYAYTKRYLDTKRMERLVSEIRSQTKVNEDRMIILLSHNQSNLKEIEKFIVILPNQVIIILSGPDWFVKIKSAAWKQHIVLHASGLNSLNKVGNEESKILLYQRRRSRTITEVTEFLKSKIQKESEPIYPI